MSIFSTIDAGYYKGMSYLYVDALQLHILLIIISLDTAYTCMCITPYLYVKDM